MGRPRSDRIGLVERVAAALKAHPDASANEVVRMVAARRSDVLRAVRLVRSLLR